MTVLGLLLLLGALLAGWHVQQQAWEQARAASIKACAHWGVELLDDTVAFHRWWLYRASSHQWHIERIYLFEFTADQGQTRQIGRVVLSREQVRVEWEGQDFLVL